MFARKNRRPALGNIQNLSLSANQPLSCSECKYIASSAEDLQKHYETKH